MQDRLRSSATELPGRPSNRRRSSGESVDAEFVYCCAGPGSGPAIWRAPAPWLPVSGDADELKLDVQRLAVERLHHIFVSARIESRADVGHVVLGGAEDDLGLVGMATLTKQAQEFHPAHDRHVPIQEDDVGHLGFAAGQRLLAVASLFDLEVE